MAHDFAKISLTARLGAYMRHFSDIPYSSDIVDLIQARTVFETFLRPYRLTPEDLHFYAPIFEARYKSVGAMIRRIAPRQVLELGAGLNPRGLSLSTASPVLYVETDLDEIIGEKRNLLATLQRRYRLPPRNNHRLAVANAFDPAQVQAAATYFKPGQRVLVVNEGLLQYFSSSETEQVVRNVHHLLAQFGGSWITPDFALKSDAEPISDKQELFRQLLADATERTLYNNAFDSIEHLREYFRGLGFQVEVINQLYLAPDLVSPDRLRLQPQLLDQLRPRLRLWHFTPLA